MPGAEPFSFSVELRFVRRRWLFMLTPVPFLWPSKGMFLPVADGEAFLADVRKRLEAL